MRGKQAPSPRSCERLAQSLSLPVEDVLAHAGHLSPAPQVGTYPSLDLQEYISRRFSNDYGDDIAAMIDDIIQECYPTPRIGRIMFGPQVE